MEVIGQIIKVCEARTGTSERTGNEWKTQGFIVEFKENETDRYFDKVYLETFKTDVINQLVEGAEVKVGFGHNTKEYNGRYYNEVNLYKFEVLGAPMQTKAPSTDGVATNGDPAVVGPTAQPTQAPQPQPGAQEGAGDDLPF